MEKIQKLNRKNLKQILKINKKIETKREINKMKKMQISKLILWKI